jgi:hypothetical protein
MALLKLFYKLSIFLFKLMTEVFLKSIFLSFTQSNANDFARSSNKVFLNETININCHRFGLLRFFDLSTGSGQCYLPLPPPSATATATVTVAATVTAPGFRYYSPATALLFACLRSSQKYLNGTKSIPKHSPCSLPKCLWCILCARRRPLRYQWLLFLKNLNRW